MTSQQEATTGREVRLRQVRCTACGKLLARVSPGAYLETKCRRCGQMFGQTVGVREGDTIA